MEVTKGKLLDQNETHDLYGTSDENLHVLHFKDSLPQKGKRFKGKGAICCTMAHAVNKYLASYHIPTHVVSHFSDTDLLVRRSEPIPVNLQVWNVAWGSLARRFKLKKGTLLKFPIVEYVLQNDKGAMINMDHICAFDLATPDEVHGMDSLVRKINAVLKSYFDRRHLGLASFTLTFGRTDDHVLLISEITPDSCSLFDMSEKSDPSKLMFVVDEENPKPGYEKLIERIV